MQTADLVVRQANDDDLQKIVDDYGANQSNPLNPFTSVDRLRQLPREGLLVAESEGVYAGFVYWFKATEPRNDTGVGEYAHIVEIRVRKAFWNTKTGLRLLARALKEIEKQEIPAVYVETDESNIHRRELYEKAGFATFGRTLHMRYLYPPDRHRTSRSHDESRELAVFLVEVREQCRAFMTAYSEVKEMILKGPPPLDPEAQRIFNARVWSRLQAALAASAVISKILWPQPLPKQDAADKRIVHRGRELRQILRLRGMKQLPVAVRNAFEHIDERISAWLPEQAEDIPWGWSLSPYAGEEEPEPKASSHALRYFNMVTEELRVADARCNLREIAAQVHEIESGMPEGAEVTFSRKK